MPKSETPEILTEYAHDDWAGEPGHTPQPREEEGQTVCAECDGALVRIAPREMWTATETNRQNPAAKGGKSAWTAAQTNEQRTAALIRRNREEIRPGPLPTPEEAMRLLTTTRTRVVPAPNEAMHIDAGNGQTLCGVRIAPIHGKVDGPGRISCIRCGRLAAAEEAMIHGNQ